MGDYMYPYTPYIFMKLFIFKECCDNNCIILYLIVKPSEYDPSSTRKVSNMMHVLGSLKLINVFLYVYHWLHRFI